MTSRFSRTFQVKQIFVNQNTGQVVVPQKITSKEVPAGTFYINLKTTPVPGNANQAALLTERLLDEIRTEARGAGKKLTPEEEQMLIASMTANLKPINTVVSDISFATRLQVEWPRAISAFLKNPLLGTGPSSITEATDNDYLRSLGEVGLLGTGLFFLIFFAIVKTVFKAILSLSEKEKSLYFGFLFGLFGLLFNAGYIDVFEASKVAFQFWFVAGLFVASIKIKKHEQIL